MWSLLWSFEFAQEENCNGIGCSVYSMVPYPYTLCTLCADWSSSRLLCTFTLIGRLMDLFAS